VPGEDEGDAPAPRAAWRPPSRTAADDDEDEDEVEDEGAVTD